jgi:hypothetical protein
VWSWAVTSSRDLGRLWLLSVLAGRSGIAHAVLFLNPWLQLVLLGLCWCFGRRCRRGFLLARSEIEEVCHVAVELTFRFGNNECSDLKVVNGRMCSQTLTKFGRVDAKHFSSIRKGQPTSLLGEPPRQQRRTGYSTCVLIYNDNHAAHSTLPIVLLIAPYLLIAP